MIVAGYAKQAVSIGYALGHALAARSNQNDAARAIRPGAPAWGWRAAAFPHRAGATSRRLATVARCRAQIGPGRGLGAPKIESKSVPGRSRDAPWRPRASWKHHGSFSGASRDVPGSLRERPGGDQRHPRMPKRTPGSVQERAEATKIDAKSRPGAKKSSFGRATWLQRSVEANFRRFLSIFGFFAKSANPPKYCACQQKQRFGPSRCESSRSHDAISKNDEN